MTGTKKMSYLVRVIAAYQAPFPDPIRVKQGDIVTIDFQKKTNISGWIWCTHESGKSGWVPESYIEVQGSTGRMNCDYDAIELTVHVGNILTVHKEESNFYWVTDQSDNQGWIPVSHVEPYKSDHREAS
jgi:uncharacterized protein YgiM (DUF1202 family)